MNIPYDKQLHFGAGACIAAAGSIVAPIWVALLAVLAAGIGKELHDWFGFGDPEVADAVYTVAGGLAAAGVIAAARWLLC